jgi:hypothetical protein
MARKKKNPLDDLTSMMSDLGYDNSEQHESVVDMDELTEGFTGVEDPIEENNEPDPGKQETEEKEGENKDEHDDDSKIPDDVLNRINNQSSEEEHDEEQDNDDDNTKVDPNEAQQIGAFFDAFAEALDWDVKDEDRPDSIESLIDYIGDVVEQNSTPQYADQRIAELDQYVKNGGKFEDFYNNRSQVESYKNLDMEDEANQKAVVRDYMKMQGYTDEQISRKIERYEDADMLEDEATDAVVYLERVREQQLQQALAEQEQVRMAQEQQAMEFMNSLNTSIASLDNIRGISVPKEDRKALLDYITKTDANGLTQYQKDFNQNMVSNLIESAYFTMKGDALLGSATRNGQTSAASKLRTMLRHQMKNHSSFNVQEEKAPQAWEMASRFLG